MRKMLIILLGVFMFAGLFAIVPPTLTPVYWDMAIPSGDDFSEQEIEAALDIYRTTYENWLESPGLYSKGQTGLMILDLFALSDTLTNAAEFQTDILANQVSEILEALWYLEESIYFITDNVENQYDLIDNLYEFMTEGKADSIVMLKDSIEAHLYDTYMMTMYNVDNTFGNLDMFGDSLGTRFDTIVVSGEDFIFRIGEIELLTPGSLGPPPVLPTYDTTEVAVIYDETFQSLAVAVSYLEKAIMYLGTGIENIVEGDSTLQGGIDTLMLSMQSIQNVCDTLNNYSLWSLFDLVDVDSSDLVEIGMAFNEAEDLLGGKTYFIHGDSDSLEVRPIGIIENIHYGLYQTYIDVYWQGNPYTYTFRNIFPNGLPEEIVGQILPDMILDPRDTPDEMKSYLTTLGASYAYTLWSTPNDVSANVGLGYIGMFAMIQDIADQGQMITALVDGGRIDSLFQNYDWTNLDYTDEIASIRNYLDHHYGALEMGDTIVYTMLIKDPNRSSIGHSIVEGDFLYPVYIIPQVTDGIVSVTYFIEDAVTAMKNGAEYLYTQVDSIMDISLDPNLLNLSNIEEPLDLIYALEAANPNFMAFTPEGKVLFAEIGDSLAVGMAGMADLADTVIATVAYAGPLLGEFGMTEEDHDTLLMVLGEARAMIGMFAADLATPEVYSIVDEDTLNLSAWFDDVPDNLLAVWKNYFEGTDSSLAGFFPMKMINPGVDPSFVPVEFALKGNYPNPFNPLTTIAFDLPSDGMVNMTVFNIAGRQVAKLIDRQSMQAGSYEMTWNAANHASGIYIVRAQYGNEVAYQKMTLLK